MDQVVQPLQFCLVVHGSMVMENGAFESKVVEALFYPSVNSIQHKKNLINWKLKIWFMTFQCFMKSGCQPLHTLIPFLLSQWIMELEKGQISFSRLPARNQKQFFIMSSCKITRLDFKQSSTSLGYPSNMKYLCVRAHFNSQLFGLSYTQEYCVIGKR